MAIGAAHVIAGLAVVGGGAVAITYAVKKRRTSSAPPPAVQGSVWDLPPAPVYSRPPAYLTTVPPPAPPNPALVDADKKIRALVAGGCGDASKWLGAGDQGVAAATTACNQALARLKGADTAEEVIGALVASGCGAAAAYYGGGPAGATIAASLCGTAYDYVVDDLADDVAWVGNQISDGAGDLYRAVKFW